MHDEPNGSGGEEKKVESGIQFQATAQEEALKIDASSFFIFSEK